MQDRAEQRRHRRMNIRLPIECTAALGGRRVTYRTVTHDISSSGVSFGTDTDDFPVGASLEMELGVPPGDGHSPYPGRVRGSGRVVRVDRLDERGLHSQFRVAAHFDKPLRLVF